MADRDQAASEADQRISDRDQDLADRELEASPADSALLHAHEHAKAGRGEGTMARMATTAVRAQVAAERHDQAWRRDEMARHRDEVAANRDREAEEIDESAERMAGELGADSPAVKVAAVARASAAAARARAAEDRERAARDREDAARDREDAARDRELLMAEIEHSHMDEPSGAYGRQIGEVLLRHEIERAQGTGAPLVLGIVTIEETARAAEGDGDPARDALARDLFFALQARIRPYDPIVRWDESEFACAASAVTGEEASRSFGDVCSEVAERHVGALARIGVAGLQKDDTLDSLIERARSSG
jgi:GGDEF domain-containing protein